MPDNKEAEEKKQDMFDRGYVEELRGESAAYRTKLREAESAVEELRQKLTSYEDANKSDVEKLAAEKAMLEKERDALIANTEKQAIDAAIAVACAKANVVDPEAAQALLDRSEVSYEDGRVKGVEKALKALLKEKEYLVGSSGQPLPSPGVGGSKSLNTEGEGGVDNLFLRMLREL